MSKKVLIVEDEFIVANDLRLLLQQAGYKVLGIAASFAEADECLQQNRPDLVILDIILEGPSSGIDFARKLRTENIAFVYLSANSNQEILEAAKATEPYGFLVKPFREQDLLVTLDIAWYRHTHSLESKLRQEALLQEKLAEINSETLAAPAKLLKIARVLQPFIPFDMVASGTRPFDADNFNDTAYLRIGFDEYQFVGEAELLTITGLYKSELATSIKNSPVDNEARIYAAPPAVKRPAGTSVQQLLCGHFNMKSRLVFPISLGYGLSVHYCFYSRQPHAYHKDHLAMLDRLKLSLEALAGKTIYYEKPAPAPVATKKSSTPVPHTGSNHIIGSHHLLLNALDLATQVATYSTSVLLLGESGTGKEKVAQLIHTLSPRGNGPFIKVNCAAIPPTLIESTLFGHEKGAFTGATEKRKGKFELADKGTIFLDEIGDLPLSMQVKLLRVLQEREIEYVGGGAPIKVDVRVITATHRQLEKEVAEGNFRLDLYYRLNVFPITLPPLRDRKSDIEPLSIFFANKYCQSFNKPFHGFAASMTDALYAYHWPGNIRELENVIEQSVVVNDGKSRLQLMQQLTSTAFLPERPPEISALEEIKQLEREYITSVLRRTNGRIRGINGAAELLHLKPTTLESKMVKLNIQKKDFTTARNME